MHTPGPWRLAPYGESNPDPEAKDRNGIPTEESVTHISNVEAPEHILAVLGRRVWDGDAGAWDAGKWIARRTANARLIAAAPDLLAALREALEFVDDIQDGAPDAHPEHRRAAELYGRLSDVIERAVGGQP